MAWFPFKTNAQNIYSARTYTHTHSSRNITRLLKTRLSVGLLQYCLYLAYNINKQGNNKTMTWNVLYWRVW